jgi:quinate dehydrogenase
MRARAPRESQRVGHNADSASITMPLKAAIIPYLDSVTDETRLTGAANTIVKVRQSDGGSKLVGTNTDYIGIRTCIGNAMREEDARFEVATGRQPEPESIIGAVIGGGATTRSAIVALRHLGCSTIFVVNRDEDEVNAIQSWFSDICQSDGEPSEDALRPGRFGLIHVRDPHELDRRLSGIKDDPSSRPRLGLIVGAIPGEPDCSPPGVI